MSKLTETQIAIQACIMRAKAITAKRKAQEELLKGESTAQPKEEFDPIADVKALAKKYK